MIIGVFLRNIKTYQGINYIPLSDGPNFCGLLGNNGIGKSSVLESFDALLNNRSWTLNTVVKKSGLEKTKPYIVPVFWLPKSMFNQDENLAQQASALDNLSRSISEDDASNSTTKIILAEYISHRDRFLSRNDVDDHYLLTLGEDYNHEISLSILNGKALSSILEKEPFNIKPSDTDEEENILKSFNPILSYVKSEVEYLYIPKEIDPDLFTKLESQETQLLMGESLTEIIDRIIGARKVTEMNTALNNFLNGISDELIDYAYRTPTDRQQHLKKGDVYNLIIQAFFNIRKLHKKQNDENWLEINSLSSGEKQKAIIEVAHSLLIKHRKNGSRFILAVDEPESSLHMSACFEQFNTLSTLSDECMQVIFTSHWYGFLPTIETGVVTIITKKENTHYCDLINLNSYREEVKQLVAKSKGQLPFDIRIKSMNDFIQSLISSATGENPYNWIICEGTTEKIYLAHYLKDLFKDKNLRIVPVGGAKEISRIYSHLSTSYKDIGDEITGCIYLLSDTDRQLVQYSVGKHENLYCKRMVFEPSKNKTILVNIDSNPVSPETEVELALNGEIHLETLIDFIDENEELAFLKEMTPSEKNIESFNYLDLRQNEKDVIDNFYNKGNNKYLFAKKYISKAQREHETPSWILELRGLIK